MSTQHPETYIPYETIATAEVNEDPSVDSFVLSIFPEATEKDIYKFRHYISGKIHDGLLMGLELSQRQAMQPIEAYRMGVLDEQERAAEERMIMEEPEEGEA